MEILPLEFPEHLNEHSLSQQEIAKLQGDPAGLALAKDWNILGRKLDWVIEHIVRGNKVLMEHEKAIEDVRRIKWLGILIGGFLGVIATLVAIWKAFH